MMASVNPESRSDDSLPVCLFENPNRLVSLGELLSVLAYDYVIIGANLGTVTMTLGMKSRMAPLEDLNVGDRSAVCRNLEEILNHCARTLRLPVTANSVAYWKTRFESPISHTEAACAISEIERVMKGELRQIRFLYPDGHRTIRTDALYTGADDDEAAGKFPIANRNIKAALRCYLCSEDTAAVFHSMRAVEKCLESVALRYRVDFAKRQWHNVIEEIEKAIVKLGNGPASSQRDIELEASSRAALQFRWIKVAWRNHVMHGRATYGDEESWKVVEHARDLTVEVSSYLTEVS
jgi:HEPN domain-containing protein